MCRVQGAAEIDPGDVDQNLSKARALGNALLCCMAAPWALCVIIYTGKTTDTCSALLLIFQCSARAMLLQQYSARALLQQSNSSSTLLFLLLGCGTSNLSDLHDNISLAVLCQRLPLMHR